MGLDEKSKGVYIYWPDKWNVTVEQTVYMDKTGASNSCFEGEEWDGFIKTKLNEPVQNPAAPPSYPWNSDPPMTSNTVPPNILPVLANENPDLESKDIPIEPEKCPAHAHKPMQKVQDLLQDVQLPLNV
jgi:hypothetical protein